MASISTDRRSPTLPLLLLLLLGCSGDTAPEVIVDMERTVVLRPQVDADPGQAPLRVAVAAMFSPRETFNHYHRLLEYIGRGVDRPIRLVQRKTYAEINALFPARQLDLAFICSGPYAGESSRFGFQALAVPQIQGRTFYQAYLIVNQKAGYRELTDLKGKVFAFTDPESNTGKLVPAFWLKQLGATPEGFFRKTIYSYSHDNAILAVAESMVDGAAVHSLIWDHYQRHNPEHTGRTRVIKTSMPFGNPPLVASDGISPETLDRIRSVLLAMHMDPAGRAILEALMIDRFVPPEEDWYAPIVKMKQALKGDPPEPS
jgi:phosphonate transport system substrate-binding protein